MLQVQDDGAGDATVPEAGTGIGLANTRGRLAALYGDAQHLHLAAVTAGQGTIVEIALPYHTPA